MREVSHCLIVVLFVTRGRLGYARLKENVTNGKADNHEGIDFYRPVENPDKSQTLWGTNQWPSIPDSEFRKKYEAWIEKMKALGLIVMEACVRCRLTPEEWNGLRSQVCDSFWVLRIIGTILCFYQKFSVP
jgi:isopenicillin N synthase-like dioxygenase